MKRPLVVTGGIASGKSTVVRFFGELGYSTLDADLVGREVFESEIVQSELENWFGTREGLRDAVRERMGDIEFRRKLDHLTHPLIFEQLGSSGADVLEIPLLIEAGLVSAFGAVVVCDCPIDVARDRLIERLGNIDLAEKMLNSQVNPSVRKVFSDEIIRTDVSLDSVRHMVQTVANTHL
ncbi:MAG: dephospho-CoA kinase [Fimbriimonadaceae bacterium]